MYFVYILHSEKLKSYYVGSTNNIVDRLRRHNAGEGKYTRKGIPWILVIKFECASRSEAVKLEYKIKKRGIKRFLDDSSRGV